MNIRERIFREVKKIPEALLPEIMDFILFLEKTKKKERIKTAAASELSLSKDWLKPEEDKAWKNL
ncbi:MAG: DUF2281 domain-containing protein [Candidatus Omnitrophota bacterium]